MRVTNRMLANNFLTDMTTNLNNLQTLQQQLTSGKEIRRPSDDPLKVARAMQLHSEIGANKQYNENIKDTLSWLEQTDTALGQLGDQTHRIRELLVSAGNVAYGTDERKKINDEIKEIIGQMSQTLNASFDGRFIFGGTRGTAKPVNVIKGPMVTKIQKSSDTAPDAKVTGDFTGKENIKYTVEIDASGNTTFKENGNKVETTPTKIDKWELEDGISLEVDKGGNMSFIKDGEKLELNKVLTEKVTLKDDATLEVVKSGDKNNYEIKVTKGTETTYYTYITGTTTVGKVEKVKKDGADGTSGTKNETLPKINKWELEDNGIAFEIKENDLENDVTYEFTALADGQKLVYADRFGKEMTDVVEVTKASEWQDKDIVFNYTDATGSKEITIKLDTIASTTGIDDLVKNINDKIDGDADKPGKLKGKLKAEVVEVNGKSYIEFTSLGKDTEIKIDSTTVSDMKKIEGKKIPSSDERLSIMQEKLVTEVSQGVRVEYNITAVDVIKFNDNKGNDRDLRIILEDIVTHLESDDAEDVKKITNEDLAALDAVMDNILKLRSQVGAKGNRMESALEKNKEENFNLTEILSKTEDIDLVEKTMEYAVAISVYMASLQTSARVLQPTLMDYVR